MLKRADNRLVQRVHAHVTGRGMTPRDGAGSVFAYVNHGRWVADCPCGGAELVTETRPLLCGSCGMVRRVVWPPDAEDIENLLAVRVDEKTQNWNPGETLAGLAFENERRG